VCKIRERKRKNGLNDSPREQSEVQARLPSRLEALEIVATNANLNEKSSAENSLG
jgi:hypothetical protein